MPARAQMGLRDRPVDAANTANVFIERQRALERENEQANQQAMPISQKFRVDSGGWFNFYFMTFDDGYQTRTLRQYETRAWLSFNADQGVHNGYVRVRDTYIDWNNGDEYGAHSNDWDGPDLERGWYEFDFAKALKLHTSANPPFGLKVKGGRDLVMIGTGYAVDLTLDHVQVQGTWHDFETTYIYGRTPASTQNLDRSRPVSDHSDYHFNILQTKYKGLDNHEPFFYAVWTHDHTGEDPFNPLQNYTYSTSYYGWGSTGELIPNLRYGSEWVIERGTSYGDRRFLFTDDVKAWGCDHRLDYFFRAKTKPTVSVEYMFASGDANRLGSPTNAEGGNRIDGTDRSFDGFGFRDTGLSFAPRLSNINIWRAGGSFRPFPDVQLLKEFEFGSDYYLYYKNKAVAAVSDSLADEQSGYLGWEMDHYINYRILSDLAWTIRFGTFFPGAAFSDQTTRTFLLTGITWSF